jgi:hypothetical protein
VCSWLRSRLRTSAEAQLRDAVVHRHRPKLAYSQRRGVASGDDDDVCQHSGNSCQCESHRAMCWGWRTSRCNRLGEAVRTAHGTPSSGQRGNVRGVDNAEAIRDLLGRAAAGIPRFGLGEKTVEAHVPLLCPQPGEVLQETRALRDAFASGPQSTSRRPLSVPYGRPSPTPPAIRGAFGLA